MAAENVNVSWLLDFRVRMYLKSAATRTLKKVQIKKKTYNLGTLTHPNIND